MSRDPATTILLVEDDPDLREAVSLALGDAGYRVISATNGAEALRELDAEQPQLILLDLMMPGMDGWQFHSALKENARHAHIPIVVLTAHDASHDLDVEAYLRKPVPLGRLLDTVARLSAGSASAGRTR